MIRGIMTGPGVPPCHVRVCRTQDGVVYELTGAHGLVMTARGARWSGLDTLHVPGRSLAAVRYALRSSGDEDQHPRVLPMADSEAQPWIADQS